MFWMSVQAATLLVPAEYETIQSALDAAEPWDSVLVDTGVYAEALIAPPLSFSLIGSIDSIAGQEPVRTVIDPTELDSPTVRTCLRVQSDTAIIERIVFLNGAAMFPRNPDIPGGIHHAAELLELRDCIFDSTHRSIQGIGDRFTYLYNCRLLHNSGACVLTMQATVKAFDCYFECDSADWGTALSSGNSQYERCQFTGTHSFGRDLMLSGQSAIVRDCLFNPTAPGITSVIALSVPDAVLEGNQFIHTQRTGYVIGLYTPCLGAVEIRNNFFTDIGPNPSGFGGSCMAFVVESENDTCHGAARLSIADNVFTDCNAPMTVKAIVVSGRGISIEHNRFAHLEPDTSSTIVFSHATGLLRGNYFENTGIALVVDSNLADGEADAAFNWWGDSTGPYHPWLNPDGLGDAVSDRVSFEPWHTDTLFFLDTPERNPILPKEAKLEVFPNPFNYVARLKLSVTQPLIVRVELFDLLGRNVRELFVGPVADVKSIRVDGSELGSGIYFARAENTIERKQIAMQKMVLLR